MHSPVLQKEVIEYLHPQTNQNFIDCTLNGGGHALAILRRNGPNGKLLGIDWDLSQIMSSNLQDPSFKKRVILVCDNFVNLKNIVEKHRFTSLKGILFDLGMSTWHIKKSGRGFSFMKNEPLVMRYSFKQSSSLAANELTANEIINNWTEPEICEILKQYGEEKFAKKISKEIIKTRKKGLIQTTFQLVEIIKKATPNWYHYKKIHFATKTFQALRIAVNQELENLKKALPQAFDILEEGGRLVVVSFHSLEDRIVKDFFKQRVSKGRFKILTKKPITAQQKEIKIIPGSRSAKLRAGQKI